MCLANFMSRRGTPKEIFSDNGTNFKATEKIVKEELKNVAFDKLLIKYDKIKWRFNPPAAPHMGAAWERLIRSIKMVLKSISPNVNYNNESLKNALISAEYVINSRPLTFVSLQAEDDDALTPNHLLLRSADGFKPPLTSESSPRSSSRSFLEEVGEGIHANNHQAIQMVSQTTSPDSWRRAFLIGSANTEQRHLSCYTCTFYELDAKLRNSKKFLRANNWRRPKTYSSGKHDKIISNRNSRLFNQTDS